LRAALHARFPGATKVSVDALVKDKVTKEGTAKKGLKWSVVPELRVRPLVASLSG
jgi:hypothetical protein